MLRSLVHSPLRAHLSWSYSRTLSVLASSTASSSSSSAPQGDISANYPYSVRRNTRGSLPVYTDVRGQNKHLTLIRNVEGNVDALVKDISRSLFPPDSPESDRLQIHAVRSRHLVLSGGKWKNEVVQWLRARGF